MSTSRFCFLYMITGATQSGAQNLLSVIFKRNIQGSVNLEIFRGPWALRLKNYIILFASWCATSGGLRGLSLYQNSFRHSTLSGNQDAMIEQCYTDPHLIDGLYPVIAI